MLSLKGYFKLIFVLIISLFVVILLKNMFVMYDKSVKTLNIVENRKEYV